MPSADWRHTNYDEKFVGEILRTFCEGRGIPVDDGVVLICMGAQKTTCQYFGPHPFGVSELHTIVLETAKIVSCRVDHVEAP